MSDINTNNTSSGGQQQQHPQLRPPRRGVRQGLQHQQHDGLGCHGRDDTYNAKFYGANVTMPRTLRDCSDDISMVEFGGYNTRVLCFPTVAAC